MAGGQRCILHILSFFEQNHVPLCMFKNKVLFSLSLVSSPLRKKRDGGARGFGIGICVSLYTFNFSKPQACLQGQAYNQS